MPVVDPGGTRVFEPEPADVTSVVPPPAATVSAPGALVSGERRFALDEAVAVVGRTKDCAVAILDDPSVSRRHAEIRLDGSEFWIVDLGSTNGTEVNGKRVSPAAARQRRPDHGRADDPHLRAPRVRRGPAERAP